MKKKSRRKRWDSKYRPESYFKISGTDTTVLMGIKGTLRRLVVESILSGKNTTGRNLETEPHLLAGDLPDESKKELLGENSAWAGGEYLPDLDDNTVEIARISMGLTTLDVISIRATKCKNKIVYSICNDWDEESKYVFSPKSTKTPLSSLEMVRFIDSARMVHGYKEKGLLHGLWRSQHEDFEEMDEESIYVDSFFYPGIEDYYKKEAKRFKKLLEKGYWGKYAVGSADGLKRIKRMKEREKEKEKRYRLRVKKAKPRSYSCFGGKRFYELTDIGKQSLFKWLMKKHGLNYLNIYGTPYGKSRGLVIHWQKGDRKYAASDNPYGEVKEVFRRIDKEYMSNPEKFKVKGVVWWK